jgi:hypothetical protein
MRLPAQGQMPQGAIRLKSSVTMAWRRSFVAVKFCIIGKNLSTIVKIRRKRKRIGLQARLPWRILLELVVLKSQAM